MPKRIWGLTSPLSIVAKLVSWQMLFIVFHVFLSKSACPRPTSGRASSGLWPTSMRTETKPRSSPMFDDASALFFHTLHPKITLAELYPYPTYPLTPFQHPDSAWRCVQIWILRFVDIVPFECILGLSKVSGDSTRAKTSMANCKTKYYNLNRNF